MSTLCECSAGLGNLGTPNCVPGFGIGRRKIFVPLKDSNGVRNYYDPSVPLDAAFLLARLNDPDTSKRWYLSPVYENGTNERADSEFEETQSGSKFKLRTGIRAESIEFFKKDTTFLSKLAKNECVEFGQFIISDTNSLMGREKASDGFLYPIAIQAYDPNWMPKTDEASEKVMLKFDWLRSEEDKYVRFVSGTDIDADFSLYDGLLDVNGSLNAAAALSFTFTARNCYGSKGNEGLHLGLVLADIDSLLNLTQSTTLTADSITETSDGVYDVVYTGATSAADILQLNLLKNGFDYAGVSSMEIVY